MLIRPYRLAAAGSLLLLTVLLWLSSLLMLSLPHQNDTLVHLQWAEQFAAALREGHLLPRWAAASISGLGDPTFLYYQPLFYYVSSAFALGGMRSEYALLCASMVSSLLLGWVVYACLLARYRHGPALLGACFIVLSPVVYFVTTSVGAFPWALSLPFSVLFVAESTRTRPRPACLAIVMSLICLSHLLSGLMAILCVGLARLFFVPPTQRKAIQAHLAWGAGVALGLGLASFFVYPAITQLHLINTNGWVQGANFDWRRAFALPTFTLAQYGFRWFAIQLPYALIALALSVLVVSRVSGIADTPGKVRARRLGWVAIAALALGSELAYPLYAMLSPLQKLQFPYRFVFVALLLSNIALVIQLNEGAWHRWRTLVRVIVAGIIAAQCAITLHLQWGQYRHAVPLPSRAHFMQGHFGQPEYIPQVRGPDWKAYVEGGKFAGECRRLALDCGASLHRTHDFSAAVSTAAPVTVRLPIFAFPAWHVVVDGQEVPLAADPATGLIAVTLPSGTHQIAVAWSRLPAEVVGGWISLMAALLVLITHLWRKAGVGARVRADGVGGSTAVHRPSDMSNA